MGVTIPVQKGAEFMHRCRAEWEVGYVMQLLRSWVRIFAAIRLYFYLRVHTYVRFVQNDPHFLHEYRAENINIQIFP